MNPSVLHCPQTTQETRDECRRQLDGLKLSLVETVMRKLPADGRCRALFDQWREGFMAGPDDANMDLLKQLLAQL